MVFPLKFYLKLNEMLRQHQSNVVTRHIINLFKKIKIKLGVVVAIPLAIWGVAKTTPIGHGSTQRSWKRQ